MSMNLIQALYDPRTPLPTDWSLYKQALGDIEFFGVSSQVYYLLQQQGKLDQTPAFFQERLKQNYMEALYLNMFIRKQTEQLFTYFESHGIDVIPLKGTVFAEKYFGHLGARATSDIDLFVHRSDLEKSIDCVKWLGYTIEGEHIPGHFHCSFSKRLPGAPVPLTIELHWDLLKDNTASLCITEFWQQASPIRPYRHIKQLSDNHTFYMICLHGWRHNLGSLKYFIDIIQMINFLNDKLDYSTLLKDATSHKTLKRIIRTLSIVYKQFPHLQQIKPFPFQRSTLWWEYRAIRKNDGNTLKNYVDFIDYQFLSYDSAKHSFIEVTAWFYNFFSGLIHKS